MTDDVRVRVGTLEDLDDMMEIALLACEENGFIAPNPQKLLAEIYPALMQTFGICGIISGDIGIEAAVLLRVGTVWYGDAPILEERAIFVHPDFRSAKGGRAARLCEFSKMTADGLGIPLTIGVLSGQRTEAKIRMYRRVMGEPTGAYWLYGASTGNHTMQH